MGMLANPFDRGKLRHDGGETGDGQQQPLVELDLDSGVVRIAPIPLKSDEVTVEPADQTDSPGSLGKRD